MSAPAARRLVVAYIVASAFFLTFPAILPFNRIEPRVFGMPFVMIWVAAWVALGFFVLLIMELAQTRAENEAAAAEERIPPQ